MSPPQPDEPPPELMQHTPVNEEADNAVPGDIDEHLGEQTTLLNNEEESFALAPVDASALKGKLSSLPAQDFSQFF